MKARGLDYGCLVRIKPDLVMISLPAVGQTGPLKDIMTFGPSLGSIAGIASLLGYPEGREAAFEYCYTDTIASVTGVFLILSCLRHRDQTGEGQFIDMAQSEASTCLIAESIMEYSMNRRVMGFQGNHSRWMAPHNLYPCKGKDRWVSIAVKTDEEWERFCSAIGNPEWTLDEKFADLPGRLRNQKGLDRLISEWTENHTPYEVMEILQNKGVAAMPSLEDEERCFTDPHHTARKSFVEVKTPDIESPVPLYNVPWVLSNTPGTVRKCAPRLGEQNDYVYGDILGLSKEEIDDLIEKEVLV
jgi:benzylsuccinate CoA-transferase BbsF subunit